MGLIASLYSSAHLLWGKNRSNPLAVPKRCSHSTLSLTDHS